MAKRARSSRSHGVFEITYPDATEPADVYADKVAIRGVFDSASAAMVLARIYKPGDAIPPAPDVNDPAFVRCWIHDTDKFAHDFLPAAACHASSCTTPNNVAVAWQGAPGSWTRVPTVIPFVGKCKTTISLCARRSLWFYNAVDNYQGYSGIAVPETGPDYRPYEVDVPEGATSVDISASGLWRHNPHISYESTANGRGDSAPLRYNDYRSYPRKVFGQAAGFTIHDLQPNPPHNLLVAMLIPKADVSEGTELAIGSSYTGLDVSNARKLLLAHHDSYEWSNNVQSIEVTLTWHSSVVERQIAEASRSRSALMRSSGKASAKNKSARSAAPQAKRGAKKKKATKTAATKRATKKRRG